MSINASLLNYILKKKRTINIDLLLKESIKWKKFKDKFKDLLEMAENYEKNLTKKIGILNLIDFHSENRMD